MVNLLVVTKTKSYLTVFFPLCCLKDLAQANYYTFLMQFSSEKALPFFLNTFYFDCFFLETLASNTIDEKFKRLSPK